MRTVLCKFINTNVHTEKLAIARFLLAFGMLLTLVTNDMGKVVNTGIISSHRFNDRNYSIPRHDAAMKMPLSRFDLFHVLPAEFATLIACIILLAVMSGYFPRLTCWLHFWVCFSVQNFFYNVNGSDSVALILSILLLPVCLTDSRTSQWQRPKPESASVRIFSGVAFLAIQVQAAFIYLLAGVAKLETKVWQEGTAVYYYTSHYRLGADDGLRTFNELFTLSPMVRFISWGVIAFELLLPLCLFASARIKKIFLIIALVFHLLIIINFGLITFFLSMSALLILFLDEQNNSVQLFYRIFRKKPVQPAVS